MTPKILCMRWTSAAYLALGLTALANGGCLWIAAGAAGGAALGYAYHEGKVCHSFNANLEDAGAAVHAALAELGMPVVKEEQSPGEGFLLSQTAHGAKVRIYLSQRFSTFQAEGPVTCICVRVATFGDHDVSARLINQVGMHLVPAGLPVPPMAPPPPAPANVPQHQAPVAIPPAGPAAFAPPQTAPPPLAN
jgi:hypothetical protein